MSAAEFEFSSPLTLLSQWRDNAGDLDEALVIGYTVDLAFLERFFIAQARGIGARITVLTDAHNAVHADVDVRGAGRLYQHGYALCQRAFHPKLVVLAGHDKVWVAIGSGNPTTSGWGHNRELWLTIKAEADSGPAALEDLARWLRDLPGAVSIPGWIATTLTEIAARLSVAATDESGGLSIIENLATSILSQLPEGRVDHLGVSAPFFDPAARAVSALIERLRPEAVTLGVQPILSSYDGSALVSALDTAPVSEIVHLSETGGRLSHGKLIEWTVSGTHTAMAGSANLSMSALLQSTASGGNCELVAFHPVRETLMPEGEKIARQDLAASHTIAATEPEISAPSLILLGARIVADGIEIDLVCRASSDVHIEGSPDGGPDSWAPLGSLGSLDGHQRCVIPVPPKVCRLIRGHLVTQDGLTQRSPAVFIIDTIKCQAPTNRRAVGPLGDYTEVFDDAALAARFTKDLQSLIIEFAEARATDESSGPAALRAANVQPDSDHDGWRMWIDSFEQAVQPSLVGLIFPSPVSTMQSGAAGWSVDTDERADVAEDEDTEDFDQSIDEQLGRRDVPSIDEATREMWKRWDRQLIRQLQTRDVDLGIGLITLRLHLDLLAGDVYRPYDNWEQLLMDLIQAVTCVKAGDLQINPEVGEAPTEARKALGGLLAVSFALLFDYLKQFGGEELDLRVQSLWRTLAPLVAEADDEAVEHQLFLPTHSDRFIGREVAAMSLRDRASESLEDPRVETTVLLEEAGVPAVYIQGVWVLDDESAPGRRTTAQILEVTGDQSAAMVRTAKDVFVALMAGEILLYTDTKIRSWRRFRMTGPFRSPRSRLVGSGGLAGSVVIGPIDHPHAEVSQICGQVGINEQFLVAALTT